MDVDTPSEIDDDAARAIAQVSQGAHWVLRIKMHDKTATLEKLARALGMFRDRHEHTSPNGQSLPADAGNRVAVRGAAGGGKSHLPFRGGKSNDRLANESI
jgi:hypothetical protein